MSNQNEISTAEKTKETPVTIIVNGRPKHVNEDSITFTEVVKLAFGEVKPNTLYTVTYSGGPKENPKGTMSQGDTVKIKSGMNFNVTATDKS